MVRRDDQENFFFLIPQCSVQRLKMRKYSQVRPPARSVDPVSSPVKKYPCIGVTFKIGGTKPIWFFIFSKDLFLKGSVRLLLHCGGIFESS
jgi:hypothetical protein